MEAVSLEGKKKKNSASWKVLILTIDSQNNEREGSIEFDGFLQIKITSVSQGNLIWWQEEGTSSQASQALLLDMCRTMRLELGSWLDFK